MSSNTVNYVYSAGIFYPVVQGVLFSTWLAKWLKKEKRRAKKNIMDADKAEFLKEFGSDYGYPNGPKSIDEIRATEFNRLDQKGPFL